MRWPTTESRKLQGALLMALLCVACAPRFPARPGPVVRADLPVPRRASVPPPSVLPAPRVEAHARPRVAFAKVLAEQGRAWREEWNDVIADALDRFGQPLLGDGTVPAEEVADLCPGYVHATREERKAFWALLFAAIARLESGFDPERNFWEPKPLRTLSVGLLQVSYGDEERHPDCPLDATAANITDPGVNLRCGVAILRDQLASRRALFPPRSYYWSVLTRQRKSITGDFNRHKAQLPFCR